MVLENLKQQLNSLTPHKLPTSLLVEPPGFEPRLQTSHYYYPTTASTSNRSAAAPTIYQKRNSKSHFE